MSSLLPSAFPPAIKSVNDWFSNWPPKESFHWQDGKSAKELAKAWLGSGQPSIPRGFHALMNTHPVMARLQIESVAGEELIPFDSFGEPRHCDLVLRGKTDVHKVVVHVEAKADERFGGNNTVLAWRDAIRRNPASNVPRRIAQLSKSLFGTEVDPTDINSLPAGVALVRYQLLYGIGATLADGIQTGATVATFIVHELVPDDVTKPFVGADGKSRVLSPRNIARNEEDFVYSVRQLSDRDHGVLIGNLIDCGVFPRSTSDGKSVRLLVGKARDVTYQQTASL